MDFVNNFDDENFIIRKKDFELAQSYLIKLLELFVNFDKNLKQKVAETFEKTPQNSEVSSTSENIEKDPQQVDCNSPSILIDDSDCEEAPQLIDHAHQNSLIENNKDPAENDYNQDINQVPISRPTLAADYDENEWITDDEEFDESRENVPNSTQELLNEIMSEVEEEPEIILKVPRGKVKCQECGEILAIRSVRGHKAQHKRASLIDHAKDKKSRTLINSTSQSSIGSSFNTSVIRRKSAQFQIKLKKRGRKSKRRSNVLNSTRKIPSGSISNDGENEPIESEKIPLGKVKCHECGKILSIKTISAHRSQHKFAKLGRVFNCKFCSYSTNLKGCLRSHMNHNHKNENSGTSVIRKEVSNALQPPKKRGRGRPKKVEGQKAHGAEFTKEIATRKRKRSE